MEPPFEQLTGHASETPSLSDLVLALRRAFQGPDPAPHSPDAASPAGPWSGQLENRVQHLQKMEALGRVALGVAHEFNNLLSVITCCSDNVIAHLTELNLSSQELYEIRRAADRCAALTQQLLTFGRRKRTSHVPADLNAVVHGVRQMLRCLVGSATDLLVLPREGPCHVRGNPGEIEQVLMNLVANARDATPPGGRITVATAVVHLVQERRHPHGAIPPGRYAQLVVSDTGCGMDAVTQARLFEPLFTTKDADKGTGLGMAIIAGILQNHRGHITVWSEPGRGARFEVFWPLAEVLPEHC